MNLGLRKGSVELIDYSIKWDNLFNKEKINLLNLLGHLNVKIDHIGSTSIYGLKSKPIIDILIVYSNISNLNIIEEILIKNGYLKSRFEPKGHPLFKKEKNNISYFYIHILHIDNDWKRYIIFKEYLIKNPSVAEEYAKLKIRLQKEYSEDRIKYTDLKLNFIEQVLKKAKKNKY